MGWGTVSVWIAGIVATCSVGPALAQVKEGESVLNYIKRSDAENQARAAALRAQEVPKEVYADAPGPSHRETFTNSLGLELVRLDETDAEGFWVSKTEITQELYQIVADDFNRRFPELPPMKANPSRFQDGKELPVERVSWQDAVKFCLSLTEIERKIEGGRHPGSSFVYSLPTVGEWLIFSEGAIPEVRDSKGTVNPEVIKLEATRPVGSRGEENPFGLQDLLGNVSEWCYDPYFPSLNIDTGLVQRFPALFSFEKGARAVVGATLLSVDGDLNPFLLSTSVTRALPDEPETAGNLGFRVVIRWGGRKQVETAETASEQQAPVEKVKAAQ